jgi:LemA protein
MKRVRSRISGVLLKKVGTQRDIRPFLVKYPQGQFRGEARSRLAGLLGEVYATLFIKQIDVNRSWANVEKQLVLRVDVIPDLINSLLAAGVQEQEMFEQIAEARSRLHNLMHAAPQAEGGFKTPEQRQAVMDANNSFGRVLARLDSLLENYPQLRSDEVFRKALDQLAGAENRLNVARVDYNSAAQDYNTARGQTRESGAAERHGFTKEPYFKADERRPAEPKIITVPPVIQTSSRGRVEEPVRY